MWSWELKSGNSGDAEPHSERLRVADKPQQSRSKMQACYMGQMIRKTCENSCGTLTQTARFLRAEKHSMQWLVTTHNKQDGFGGNASSRTVCQPVARHLV